MTYCTYIILGKVRFEMTFKCTTFVENGQRETSCYCVVSRVVNTFLIKQEEIQKALTEFEDVLLIYAKSTWGDKLESYSKPLREKVAAGFDNVKIVLFFQATKLDEIVYIPRF